MTADVAGFSRKGADMRAVGSVTSADVLVFLIPALLGVNFQVGGRLYVSELIALASLPFFLAGRSAVWGSRGSLSIVMFGLLWLWAQIVTDLYRATPFTDLARGWLNIAFTIVDFVAVLMLIADQRRRVILFTFGLALGYASAYLFNPSVYAAVDPWKFGVATPVTLLIVLLSCHPALNRIPLLASALLFFGGTLNFALGFRSLGGVCLLATAYVAAQAFSGRRSSLKFTPIRLAALCAIGVAFGILLVTVYSHAARDGFLGTAATQKYRQESGGKFGFLVGGRPELFASSKAITDSPLIGHGSKAKDPKYTNELLSVLYRNGYQADTDFLYGIRHSGYLIPAHSYLFQSWVEAGLLGAVFWLVVLALVLNGLVLEFRMRTSLSPLIAFLAISVVWSVFFSPYGADGRMYAMFSIAAILTCRMLPRAVSDKHVVRRRVGFPKAKLASSSASAR